MDDYSSVLSRIDDCNKIASHCRKHDVVIQAGSHLGLYPERLAKLFKQVITFEACIENFNKWTPVSENIRKHHAALGDHLGSVGIIRVPNHDGQGHISEVGDIPLITIDSLCVEDCDLIYLDIEGYEIKALSGAIETINKFNPIIAVENKKLIRRHKYGSLEQFENFFISAGYKRISKYNLDCVYAPISSICKDL